MKGLKSPFSSKLFETNKINNLNTIRGGAIVETCAGERCDRVDNETNFHADLVYGEVGLIDDPIDTDPIDVPVGLTVSL